MKGKFAAEEASWRLPVAAINGQRGAADHVASFAGILLPGISKAIFAFAYAAAAMGGGALFMLRLH